KTTRKLQKLNLNFQEMDGYCWMALAPDGKTVALGTVWNALQLWDVGTGKELFTEHEGHFSQINGLAFSPDSKTLASCGGNGPVLLWETATWRRSATVPGPAFTVAFSPKGLHFASVGSLGKDTMLRIWDVTAKKDTLLRKVSGTTAAAFSPDGRQ